MRPDCCWCSRSSADAHIVLTVRADTLGRHGGQVSLPGGVVEPGESFERAALREAHEEVALAPEHVRVLGALTPLDIPVSGFRLHPIVAVAAGAAAVDAGRRRSRADPRSRGRRALWIRRGRSRSRGCATAARWRCRRSPSPASKIWGATAMVLAEFLTLLGWKPEATAEGRQGRQGERPAPG